MSLGLVLKWEDKVKLDRIVGCLATLFIKLKTSFPNMIKGWTYTWR